MTFINAKFHKILVVSEYHYTRDITVIIISLIMDQHNSTLKIQVQVLDFTLFERYKTYFFSFKAYLKIITCCKLRVEYSFRTWVDEKVLILRRTF